MKIIFYFLIVLNLFCSFSFAITPQEYCKNLNNGTANKCEMLSISPPVISGSANFPIHIIVTHCRAGNVEATLVKMNPETTFWTVKGVSGGTIYTTSGSEKLNNTYFCSFMN